MVFCFALEFVVLERRNSSVPTWLDRIVFPLSLVVIVLIFIMIWRSPSFVVVSDKRLIYKNPLFSVRSYLWSEIEFPPGAIRPYLRRSKGLIPLFVGPTIRHKVTRRLMMRSIRTHISSH